MSTKIPTRVSEQFGALPPDVFEGSGGHLIICQEWPNMQSGERYYRVFVDMDQVRALADAILKVAKDATS
jgi:hypothetical protein